VFAAFLRERAQAWISQRLGPLDMLARAPAAPHANALLVEAIERRRRLSCRYKGKPCKVVPQCYGVDHSGNELLRVYRPRGGSAREPLFNVAEIEELVALDERFSKPGPNYKRDDPVMKTIYAQL
jgi:hypothetical protein